ncbi:MAG: carboxypeptidase regulatory-like domain-containing protein [Rudaea sp.]|uniref:carboxypeptidase regulatory-like domain-containing protein n=1 Tax=unclassified Rudaea TaxID=2627037 RepID=UPI0010F9A9F8|nr:MULTISPECIES: carboxypeptidase regulatory-like domain-containing protein [unclassified Rudaea]MBN8884469.1 carboxypeptidase regulatory-like domain-containing protein [Rudaea sp.]
MNTDKKNDLFNFDELSGPSDDGQHPDDKVAAPEILEGLRNMRDVAVDLNQRGERLVQRVKQATAENSKRVAAQSKQIRWPLVLRWWGSATAVALVAIGLILWNGHRLVEQGAVEGRNSTEQVEQHLKEAVPAPASTIAAAGPTGTTANAGQARTSPVSSAPIAVPGAPWPPQAVTAETCVAGIPSINEGAQNLSPDKSDLARLNAWHAFTARCLGLTRLPFDGNYGSYIARRQPTLEPAPSPEQATPETCAARLPIFNQLRLKASGQVEGIQEWNKFQAACQKLAEAGGASASRAPMTPFNAAEAAPISEPMASTAPTRASSEGLAEVVPPVPPTATAQTCALGLDSLNRVHELKRALTVREQDWTQFGYACLGLSPAPLVADARGYGLAQKSAPKAAPATQSEPVARTPAPKSAPASPVAVATGSIDRATCEARLLDINSSNGKTVVDMTPAQRDAVGVASRCLAARLITATRNGFVMAKGGGAITTTVTTSGSDGKKCVIKGAVVSQDGTPLSGATVSLTGQGIAVNATLTTDANGGWASGPLPDGSVLAVFSADRHFSAKATLSTCSPVAQAPVSLETCNAFSCAARRLDEKLHLGGH